MKLFIFEHCPFCVKAMMVSGYKHLDTQFEIIQNHDVQSRIDKVGANMVPILQKPDGSYMAESLDIVAYLDKSDGHPILQEPEQAEQISRWLAEVQPVGSVLVYPR